MVFNDDPCGDARIIFEIRSREINTSFQFSWLLSMAGHWGDYRFHEIHNTQGKIA